MSASVSETSWKRRRVGTRLGRYVLGTCLGAGGAAGVYLARLDGPRGFERVLALKIVHEHLLEDPDFAAMFLDEANLSVRLSHPNIIHTYELAHQGALLFIAMEYLAGKPLSRLYRRAFECVRPLPYELVAWIIARAADALHYAHELRDESGKRMCVVHRDVSPDNLVVTYDGQVKVIDFGIARAEGRIASTELGRIKGKFRYMSPEYALGQSFDHRLDLFALGATLYESALGLSAFEAGDDSKTLERLLVGDIVEPRSLRHDFPSELARIIRRAIDADATRRFESGAQMAAELDAFARLEARDAQARLSTMLRDLFAAEMETELGWVHELRSFKAPPTQEAVTPTDHSVTRTPPRLPARRWLWPVGALAAVGLASGTALVHSATKREPGVGAAASSAVVPARPPNDAIVIDIAVQPPFAPAVVRADGRLIADKPPRLRLTKSQVPVRVEVDAPGFEPAMVQVVPDRDHFLVVPLTAIRPGASAELAPAERAPATKSGHTRPAKPRPSSSGSSGVIRDNPFTVGTGGR